MYSHCLFLLSWFTDWSWSNLLVELIGAALGGVITILVFYSEIAKDRNKEKERRDADISANLKYFAAVIRNILKDIELQIESAEKVRTDIIKKPLLIPLLSQSGVKDLHRIVYTLDQEKFYHAFLDKYGWLPDSIKTFRNIYSCLDFFDATSKNELQSLDKKIIYNHERKTEYIRLVREVIDTVDFFILHPPFNDEEYKAALVNWRVEFRKIKPTENEINFYQDNFVTKIAPLLEDKKEAYKEVAVLLIQLRKAYRLYDEIPKQNFVVVEELEKWITIMKETTVLFKGITYTLRKEN